MGLILILRIVAIIIRLFLLTVSVVGWIVFVVSFVQLRKKVHSYYTDPDTYPFGPEFAKLPLQLAHTLFIPMWVFLASGPATYIPLGLHIIVCHENIKHILHSAFMFFNVLFMFGGSGTLLIAMAFSVGKSAETLRSTVHMDETSSRTVLYGTSISIGMYWISTFIWPLFNLKRKPSVYSYREVNIQEGDEEEEDDDRWARPHKMYYSNSGRFSNSRELCQQVSEEEGNYSNWND